VNTIAVAVVCKTPRAGFSKTRLSPPLTPQQCAELSACFIEDIAATIDASATDTEIARYAVYTPLGSEAALRPLLRPGFHLLPQCMGDLGARLTDATARIFAAGHAGVIFLNADGPTLPPTILHCAIDALRGDNALAISPALDGGYTLIGLSRPCPEIFAHIPWSTSRVYATTIERARTLRLRVTALPLWYDVDDAQSFALLQSELAGKRPSFAAAALSGAPAHATRRFLAQHKVAAISLA
jgi:rSAM/selenodomain-associated transferase 1